MTPGWPYRLGKVVGLTLGLAVGYLGVVLFFYAVVGMRGGEPWVAGLSVFPVLVVVVAFLASVAFFGLMEIWNYIKKG